MQKPDPYFSHLSQDAREEVFKHLHRGLDGIESYSPMCRQNPYWKARVVDGIWRKWERWSFMAGWRDDYSFALIESCFECVLEELGPLALLTLLDPRLQIEVVPISSEGFPVWAAFPLDQHKWITAFVEEVRPSTEVLLLLFEPQIDDLSQETTMKHLRHEIGHVLLFLSDPEAANDCQSAEGEWKRATEDTI